MQEDFDVFKKLRFFMIALLAISLAACGEAEISKVDDGDDSTDQKEENKSEEQNLQIGDSVNFDGLKITLNEARIEEGGEFDEPENDQFVVVNLTVENTTDEEQVVSSILNVELKDSENYSYSTTILLEGTKGQLDGSVEPGGSLRGDIPFDVPQSEEYQLHFSDPFKSGKAIWIIPSSELQ